MNHCINTESASHRGAICVVARGWRKVYCMTAGKYLAMVNHTLDDWRAMSTMWEVFDLRYFESTKEERTQYSSKQLSSKCSEHSTECFVGVHPFLWLSLLKQRNILWKLMKSYSLFLIISQSWIWTVFCTTARHSSCFIFLNKSNSACHALWFTLRFFTTGTSSDYARRTACAF